jgi:CheY-like chemotaxis protein
MNADTQAHLFEPFFTTKGAGRGTGLGLATIYGIVISTGGIVRLYSEPGIGTSVKVYLPATAAEVTASTALREPEPRRRDGNERVLIVEDEPAVRELARRLLEDAGFNVLCAANGPEALGAWDDSGGPIDLVLTDLIMPGMSGRELAHRLRAQQPTVNVLYMSGYTAGLLGEQAILEEGEEVLEKPFTRSGLLRKIEAALGPLGAPASTDTDA